MRPADSARPRGSRSPDAGPTGPAVRPVTSDTTPPDRPGVDRISKKIWRAPESFLSRPASDLERGDPESIGPPLPQELQTCRILIVEGETESCGAAWGFGGRL